MKFILDIDGVMVHANPYKSVELEDDGFYKFNDKAVEIFNSMFRITKDEIILSTSHRYRYSIHQWKTILKDRGISSKKIAILDVGFSINSKVTRRTEIETWISDNNINHNDIVILDDDKSLNDLPLALKQRLCLTSPYTGLNNIEELKQVVKREVKRRIKIECKYYRKTKY